MNLALKVSDKEGFAKKQKCIPTKRNCSIGMEFLIKNGTPRSFTKDNSPVFSVPPELSVSVVDYSGCEEDFIPQTKEKEWFLQNFNHALPRVSDLDRIVVQFHCQHMPIACTVNCMLNGSASVNEYSARYAELPEGSISTADLKEILPEQSDETIKLLEQTIKKNYADRHHDYKDLVNLGVIKELSRGTLPVSQNTEFFTKLSLYHIIKFIQIYEADALMAPFVEQLRIIFQLGYPCIYSLFKAESPLNQPEQKAKQFLSSIHQEQHSTYRQNSEALEDMIGQKQIVLTEDGTPLDSDKCWVKVTEYLGTTNTPYNAVKMSFGVDEEDEGAPELTESLLQLLVSLGHGSPFELPTLFFETRVPFLVFRHLIRHRTMGMYQWKFADDVYIPNVRGQKPGDLKENSQMEMKTKSEVSYREAQQNYLKLQEAGLPESICELVYSVNRYVELSCRVDIHNLAHFLRLRTNPATQYETRMVANLLKGVFEKWVPVIYSAFVKNNRLS